MRRPFLALLLLIAETGAAETCEPTPGLEEWIRPGAVVILGEIHGTAESPAFAGAVACQAAAAGLPVIVGLELHTGGQARLEAFLDRPEAPQTRRNLLSGADWSREYQDGRNSRAMLGLIERLGRARRAGSAVRVVLFDPGTAGGGQARDRGMATRLAGALADETDALAVILTGNLHSRTSRGMPGNAEYEPMGHLLAQALPPGRVLSLDQAHGGGTAWICSRTCGVTQLAGRNGERPGIVEIGDDRPSGHDGWYRVGRITASPPARLSAAEVAELKPAIASPPAALPAPLEPPSPTPPISSQALSPSESRLQGDWQGYDHRRGYRTWDLEVDGRRFRAEGSGEWYEGHLLVGGNPQQGWVDFVIERCRCAYGGSTARAIFEWTGENLLVAATAPGNPRPDRLEDRGVQLLRFVPQE